MNTFKSLFKLGGAISNKLSLTVGIAGFLFLMILWYVITTGTGWVRPQTIPSPGSVIYSFIELFSNIVKTFVTDYKVEGLWKSFKHIFTHDNLISNIIYSMKLNIAGYAKAILFSIPVGFLVALIPLVRSMFSKYIDALRYVPLTGLIGVFIAWFGLESGMKINFLAFGIIVYLLPIVVIRVYGTEKVYIDTLFTLGANSWQTFKKVYWPSVISRLFDDIRVITAISWTYIIVAEMQNNEGGIGAMVYASAKQSSLDRVFAVLLIIVIIGFLQDILFKWADKKLFKFKHV